MPEGDTLHKVADFMRPRLVGCQLLEATAARCRLPELQRRQVRDVQALGKHLLVTVGEAAGWTLRVHLGMHGSWHVYRRGERWRRPAWQASVVLTTAAEVYVCFNAADVECLRAGDAADHASPLPHLGPDLLADEVDLPAVLRRARRRPAQWPLCDVLLDQSVACGIGNVFKCELLFLHQLPPWRQLGQMGDAALGAVYADARHWMQANLGGWMRTLTVDRRQAAAPPPAARLWVYGRVGMSCRICTARVMRRDMGRHRRSTYWCPRCQR